MATAAQEAELQALFVLLGDSRSTNAYALAAFTLLVLEHVSTLDFEIEHVWKTKRSWANAFYVRFFALAFRVLSLEPSYGQMRYYTLISVGLFTGHLLTVQTSDAPISSTSQAQAVILSIVIVSVDLVLVARVWILYRRSRIFLWIFLPLIAVELVGILVVGILQVEPLNEYIHAGRFLTGCYSTGTDISLAPQAARTKTSILVVPRLFVAYAVAPTVISFLMFVMTLYKCGTAMIALRPGRTPIFAMFLRDGLLWFLIACSVVGFVIWSRGRPSLVQLSILPNTAITSCCAARVLINIKYAVAVDHIHGAGTTLSTVGTSTIGSAPRRLPIHRGQGDSEPWYLKDSTPGM
ncbi:hypothetical protein C8F01DRAFT_1259012 [Mycena amicta]|nr:hypothetical protein C8F01DRAFT_1259012 [Mycena amicta]